MLYTVTRGSARSVHVEIATDDATLLAALIRPATLRPVGAAVEPLTTEEDAAQPPLFAGHGAPPPVPQRPGRKPAPAIPEVVQLVREHLAPGLHARKAEIAAAIGKHPDDVDRALGQLEREGAIRSEGERKARVWFAVPPSVAE